MLAKINRSRKFVTAEVVAVLSWVGIAYVPDGSVNRAEWFALAVGLASAAGVYVVPNEPPVDDAPPA